MQIARPPSGVTVTRPFRRQTLLAVGVLACPPLIHLALLAGWSGGAATSLLALQAALVFALLRQALPARRRVFAWAALVPFGLELQVSSRLGLAASGGVSHAAVNLALLALFARTLLPGREPLISSLARRLRGPLPPELERYTRRVTVAWCLFFIAELLVSAGLLAFAPRTLWSGFVGLSDLPPAALMFGVEYGWRRFRYPHLAHFGLRATLRAFAGRNTSPVNLPR